MIEYFLTDQDVEERGEERKARLQVMILLLAVVIIPLITPIVVLNGNAVDLIATCFAYSFFIFWLYRLRKGISYKRISASFLVILVLVNFSRHLLYASRPLIPVV